MRRDADGPAVVVQASDGGPKRAARMSLPDTILRFSVLTSTSRPKPWAVNDESSRRSLLMLMTLG